MYHYFDEVLTQVDHATGQDQNKSSTPQGSHRGRGKGRGKGRGILGLQCKIYTLEINTRDSHFPISFFRISDPTECGTVRYKFDDNTKSETTVIRRKRGRGRE